VEVVFYFFDLLIFPFKERVLFLFLLIRLQHRWRIAADVLEIDVHFPDELKFTPIFNVVEVEPVSDTVVDTCDNDEREDD